MKSTAVGIALLGVVLSNASQAASPFDGVYTGASTWAGNGNRRCTGTPDFKITVRDGQFAYGGGGERVPVNVSPDGSFSAQSGGRNIQGKISGNQLTASTSGGSCNYLWDLHK